MQQEKDNNYAAPPTYGTATQQPISGESSGYPIQQQRTGPAHPAQSPGPQMMGGNGPPQQHHHPQPTGPQATPLGLLRDTPQHVFCPVKGHVVQTRAESKDSDKTWFAVIGICLICPCVACAPLKCCGAMLQDWDQYCTGCGKQLTHQPYNREAQVMAPDHDVAQGAGQYGGQYYPQQPQYMQQQQQPQYAPPQQQQQQPHH